MNETDVTVIGFVGTQPELRPVGGTVVASSRISGTTFCAAMRFSGSSSVTRSLSTIDGVVE